MSHKTCILAYSLLVAAPLFGAPAHKPLSMQFVRKVDAVLPPVEGPANRWGTMGTLSGQFLYMPSPDGIYRVTLTNPSDTPQLFSLTDRKYGVNCKGKSFSVLSLSSFVRGKAYAFTTASQRLHEVSDDGAIGPPILGSEMCGVVARLDDELIACGSLIDIAGTRSRLVDIRDRDLHVRASAYDTTAEVRPGISRLFVAATEGKLYVGETQSPHIRVFAIDGRELRSISLRAVGYRSPTAKIDFENFKAWFLSFTPLISIAADGPYVGASYRTSRTTVHTVIYLAADGTTLYESPIDDEFVLAAISGDRFVFTDAMSRIKEFKVTPMPALPRQPSQHP